MDRKQGSKQVPAKRKQEILDMTALGVWQCDIAQYYSMAQPTVLNIIRSGRNATMNKTKKREPKKK